MEEFVNVDVEICETRLRVAEFFVKLFGIG